MKQVLCHLIGDYMLQSHWMAQNKPKSNVVAAAHAVTYAVPFVACGATSKQTAVIVGTHFIIDRFRLARYVMWAKDWIAPRGQKHEFTATGMQEDVPPFLAVWLTIIVDNTMHLIINRLTLGDT